MKQAVKTLFLLKKGYSYGDNYIVTSRSGLYNSAHIAAEQLKDHYNANIDIEVCVDANEIDKFLHKYKPTNVIIEALWVTPQKLKELVKLHPRVDFFVRIHSKISFLAMEGIAVEWINAYQAIKHVYICANSRELVEELEYIGVWSYYLPNLYNSRPIEWYNVTVMEEIKFLTKKSSIDYSDLHLRGEVLNIASFGSIRPLKNQLQQAISAIAFAERCKCLLRFHINANRVEQKGDPVLKNIRALFEGSDHELIEHNWLSHDDFLALVGQMDLGMQLSYTETFNIVAADFVNRHVPIICSSEIDWIGYPSIVRELKLDKILERMKLALYFRTYFVKTAGKNLSEYNKNSLQSWKVLLNL